VNIAVHVVNVVDNVAIGRVSPVQQATLEQRKRFTLVLHDRLDPAHPLISGNFIQGAKDHLVNAGRLGYMWVWRTQAIDEDQGFWLMFMPLPKGLGLFKAEGVAVGAAERITETVAEGVTETVVEEVVEKIEEKDFRGVYDLGTTGGRYIGQSQNVFIRMAQHFAKGGKLFGLKEIREAALHMMPGSSKLEREVYEQYQIDKAGIDNLRNIRNPMGGRRELYNQMLEGVITKYNLPR
jgi:hypothetical protein